MYSTVSAAPAGDARRHDEGLGFVRGGHDALVAADRPALAAALGAGGHVVQAIARLAFLVREHDQRLAGGDARQPLALQRGRCLGQQRRRDQRAGGERRVDQAAAEFLHHHHRLDRAEAHAAVRLGDRQAVQAQFGQFAHHLAGGAARLGDAVAALEGEALVDPARDEVAQGVLVVGEIEIHGQLPST
jgi:hypothetical protein